MNPTETFSHSSSIGKIEKVAYYIFLATVFLAPLVFVGTSYLAIEVAKTLTIAIGTLTSAILYGLVIIKEKKINAPPKGIFLTISLLAVSIIISSLLSIHSGKSLFGQGFEINTASFIILMFVAAWVAYEVVRRSSERLMSVYMAIVGSFLILFLIHMFRLVFGADFLSLGLVEVNTSTLIGKWYDLSFYAASILIILVSGLITLKLPNKVKAIYSVLAIIAIFMIFWISTIVAWFGLVIVFALLVFSLIIHRHKVESPKEWPWLAVVFCLISIAMVWQGTVLSGWLAQKTGTIVPDSDLVLPWQITVDVAGGAIKNYPWFGVGPNHFSQAFMVYRPADFNLSSVWAAEFNTGFGLIPTFIIEHGCLGIALWIIFLVLFGMMITRGLSHLPENSHHRFAIISSSMVAVFLWFVSIVYIPSHVIFYATFIFSGIALSTIVSHGALKSFLIDPNSKVKTGVFKFFILILILIAAGWLVIHIKKTIALGYFASGVGRISAAKTIEEFGMADKSFRRALAFDESDVYWKALSESSRLKVVKMIGSATSTSPAFLESVVKIVDEGVASARKAIGYDPSYYYNYVSEARISSLALSIGISSAYDNAVRAYNEAIRYNPSNPSLYLALAQLQAENKKYDEALQTLGMALQQKSNYIDAVYLVSQIQAIKGNLPDAITAAEVTLQLNPNNALYQFNLGVLEYQAKDYAKAVTALTKAVEIEPTYANARYFLGLSLANIGRSAEAINHFESLVASNPDNDQLKSILSNIRAGRSPMYVPAAVTSKPASKVKTKKSVTLPIEE